MNLSIPKEKGGRAIRDARAGEVAQRATTGSSPHHKRRRVLSVASEGVHSGSLPGTASPTNTTKVPAAETKVALWASSRLS